MQLLGLDSQPARPAHAEQRRDAKAVQWQPVLWFISMAAFDELDQLALAEDDDDALSDWVAEQLERGVKTKARKTSGGAREWDWDPCQPWDGTPPDRCQSAYLHAAMRDEIDKVAKTAKGGRNDAIFEGALKLGSYVAGAVVANPDRVVELTVAASGS